MKSQIFRVVICLLWPIAVYAGTPMKEGLIEAIQQRYQSLESFHGKFTQTNYFSSSETSPKKAEGTVAYQRVGKMRWNYAKPNEQLLVTDGTTVWLFDPLLENVTIRQLDQVTQGTALAFLLGKGHLQHDFSAQNISKKLFSAESKGLIVELKPKQAEANLELLQLLVDSSSYDIKAVALLDNQGNYRIIEFLEMAYNQPIDPRMFHFEVTPEMEVINTP
ncbi:MAG: outer membrane lipoprotein chaperone LolA [SAR324 cluster bacterium]|nr:outer membrane lipoprotein chaperone LolA [SAR324 cluster bacterium]